MGKLPKITTIFFNCSNYFFRNFFNNLFISLMCRGWSFSFAFFALAASNPFLANSLANPMFVGSRSKTDLFLDIGDVPVAVQSFVGQPLAELKAKGVHLIDETTQVLPGRRMAFIHPKANGEVMVELYELKKLSGGETPPESENKQDY